MIDPGLRDRVALVGAKNPRGIGAATAKAFASVGAKVFFHYLSGGTDASSDAASLVQAIRAAGGEAEGCQADLRDPDSVPFLFDEVEKTFGPVEILLNNAAHAGSDTFIPREMLRDGELSVGNLPMVPLTAKSHDDHFVANSRATSLMMAEFARRHCQRGGSWGRIVNVSTDGASAFVGQVSYGASKHAIESFSRAAACELGPYGITVNVVSPGAVQTGWIPPEKEKEWGAAVPLGRIGKPEDIAAAILFFCSEQASWITGQLLYVDGGDVMPL